ncbi:MAG TPA: DNA polymerase III subunit gamma/tau [Gillisia sp.]|nr:DNA polymerase III subunit gamma/tau [Gillisia sp.]
MEHFVVSARKYRPQTFNDVVGQQAITNTLLNAIKNDHLAQALLFTGPRGVGKTTCARILAKMINHDGSQQPDEDFAFNIFELDAASNNSVDDIRNLTDQVRIPPQVGNYKVYIIDEVHMLSTSAFNAFLKTLEEPPKHAIFILATTEKHKIIPTILSRCQIFDFKRITVNDVKNYLTYIAGEEGVTADEDALHIIAQKADGAMRDALSIYDRVVSFSGNNLTRQAVTENLNVLDYETYLNVTGLILENNIPQLLVEFNEILARGFDGHHFIAGLASHFRDLLVCRNPKTIHLLEVGDTTKTSYYEQSQKTSEAFLMQGIELANDCDLKYKSSRNQRLLVELCLMQLASITFDGEKKKPEHFIIPASNFKATPAAPAIKLSSEEKKVVTNNEYAEGNSAPQPAAQVPNPQIITLEEVKEPTEGLPDPEKSNCHTQPVKEETPVEVAEEEKISPPPLSQEKVSGLSIKSIRLKKEMLARQQGNVDKAAEVLSEKFTETQLHAAWDEYIHRLKNKGEKILASIMETDMPTVSENTISMILPADTMKKDLERGQNPLMAFLKKKLKNTLITLEIQVNESTAKKFAYSNLEKYNKLKEKNPLIEKLRTTFDLDL